MKEEVDIKLRSDGTIEVEGVRISIVAIQWIVNPPNDRLFGLRRVDDRIEVTQYMNAESAAKFFET